jgi:hypothetical protein
VLASEKIDTDYYYYMVSIISSRLDIILGNKIAIQDLGSRVDVTFRAVILGLDMKAPCYYKCTTYL